MRQNRESRNSAVHLGEAIAVGTHNGITEGLKISAATYGIIGASRLAYRLLNR